jgi:hypothetical protein
MIVVFLNALDFVSSTVMDENSALTMIGSHALIDDALKVMLQSPTSIGTSFRSCVTLN